MLNENLINTLSKVTLAVVLMIILITGQMGLWVFGTTYKEVRAEAAAQLKSTKDDYIARLTEVRGEADEWKKLALEGIYTAESAKRIRTKPPAPETTTLQDAHERLQAVQEFNP